MSRDSPFCCAVIVTASALPSTATTTAIVTCQRLMSLPFHVSGIRDSGSGIRESPESEPFIEGSAKEVKRVVSWPRTLLDSTGRVGYCPLRKHASPHDSGGFDCLRAPLSGEVSP